MSTFFTGVGPKKDSSDEVLRQQMRKVVDTSNNPGRIVLISGKIYYTNFTA